MAMIQGIDGAALLNAFRQGKEDGFNDRMRQSAMQKQRMAQGLIAQVFGDQAPQGGVAGMAQQAVQQPTFGQAFGADTAAALPAADQGKPLPSITPAPQAPQRGGINYDALRKLQLIDPEMGAKIATNLKTVQETELKAFDAKNAALGTAAYSLMQMPAQERAQFLQTTLAPYLMQAGVSPQEIAQADLSDRGLQSYFYQAQDMHNLLSDELARRKFEAGDIVTPQPGAGAFRVKPNGAVETIVAPNDGTHPVGSPVGNAPSGIPKAAADYLMQHPELRGQFDQKYGAGAAERILGGGGGNVTSGFRP